MSILVVLDVSLRKIHAVISPLMFKKMIFAREAVVALAAAVIHVAVN
jgi:hypothetical protein